MNPDQPQEAAAQANSWRTLLRANTDPEETIKDCVLFIAFSHFFAIIYFILKLVKDAVCGW